MESEQALTTLKDVLDYAATKYDVPNDLVYAVAWNESSLNPKAVGDNDSSFGLFQLHRGGELGNLSEDEAFNPLVNSETALGEFKSLGAEDDLGAWAAKAQRPADAAGYATRVNVIVQAIKTNQMPDSYGRALNAEVDVELPSAPKPEPEPAPVVNDETPAEKETIAEEVKVESATNAQIGAVNSDLAAGKVSAAEKILPLLETHVQELQTVIEQLKAEIH